MTKVTEEGCKIFSGDFKKLDRFSLNCDIRYDPGKGDLITFPTFPTNFTLYSTVDKTIKNIH